MGSTATDVDRIWAELSDGIEEAYNCRGMNKERFMKLYSHVYSFCAKDSRPKQMTEVERAEWAERRKEASRRGKHVSTSGKVCDARDLYQRIRNKTANHLRQLAQSAEEKDGENLLNYYLAQWTTFTFGSKVVDGTCSYLNRHWISREQGSDSEGEERVFQIYQLAMNIWKETLLEPFQKPMITFVLELIRQDRKGEFVDKRMIQGMTQSLVELGEETDVQVGCTHNRLRYGGVSIYRARFEDKLIADTVVHYAQESKAFLQSVQSVPDYLRKVEQWLTEEADRVRIYLNSSTLDRLLRTCENVLIARQLPILLEAFTELLKEDKTEDMRRLYRLISKATNSFQGMSEALESHVTSEGRGAIKLNKEKCAKSPAEYIKTILGVYNKFSGLVNEGFRQNPDFVAALDKGCKAFVNENDLTEELPHLTPRMLAKYCDALMKKVGQKHDDQELEGLLNQALVIFVFVVDKDVFQNYYTQLLANRLVLKLSSSDDAEASMITKLKAATGYEYTVKMHRMIMDVAMSPNTNEDFKSWLSQQQLAQPMKVDFSTVILQSGSWPLKLDTCDNFMLPQELALCITYFSQYYKGKHESRRLQWLYSKSHGEIVASCFGDRKYTFTSSTYSIAILLQYNSADEYTIQGLMDATQLTEEVVIQVVLQLIKARLLKLREPAHQQQESLPKSKNQEEELSLQSVVYLFLEYKNKKMKVNLLAPPKAEVQKDDKRCEDTIEKSRLIEVKAAIVRVMKARKELGQQQMIIEVVEMMKCRFSPPVNLIKKSIEELVTAEYLRLKEGSTNVFQYIS